MLAQQVERLSFRVEWYDSVQERSYELVLRAYADGDGIGGGGGVA